MLLIMGLQSEGGVDTTYGRPASRTSRRFHCTVDDHGGPRVACTIVSCRSQTSRPARPHGKSYNPHAGGCSADLSIQNASTRGQPLSRSCARVAYGSGCSPSRTLTTVWDREGDDMDLRGSSTKQKGAACTTCSLMCIADGSIQELIDGGETFVGALRARASRMGGWYSPSCASSLWLTGCLQSGGREMAMTRRIAVRRAGHGSSPMPRRTGLPLLCGASGRHIVLGRTVRARRT